MILTAQVTLRYKLRERPNPHKLDDGFIVKAGESIHITPEALAFFHAVDGGGKPTKRYFVSTPTA